MKNLNLPEKIADKAQMYGLFERGVFGNAGLNFKDVAEAEQHTGTIGMRYKGGKGGNRFDAGVPPLDLRKRVQEWRDAGLDPDRIQYSAMMPDHLLRLQGEVQRSTRYYDLRYNDTPGLTMRQGMAASKHTDGLRAHMMLRTALEAADYDDMMELFETWPDAIIEFTAYHVVVGNCPRRNTIIWEVRTDY